MCKYIDPHKRGPFTPQHPLPHSPLPCGTRFTSDEHHPDFLCAFQHDDCIEYRVRSDVDVSVCFASAADWTRYGEEVTLHPRLCPCTNAKRCRMMNSDLGLNESAVLFISPDESAIAHMDVRARRCSDADDSVLSVSCLMQRESPETFGTFKRRQFAGAVAASVGIGPEDSDIISVLPDGSDAIVIDLELSLVNVAALERAVERVRNPAFGAEVIAEMSEDGYYQLSGLTTEDMRFTVLQIDTPQRLPWFDLVLGIASVLSFVAAYAAFRCYKDGVLSHQRGRRRRRERRARDDDKHVNRGLLSEHGRSTEMSATSGEREGIIKSAIQSRQATRRSGAGITDEDGVRRRSSAKGENL